MYPRLGLGLGLQLLLPLLLLHAPWSKRPPVIFRLRFQPSGPCGPFPGLAWRIVAAVQRGAAPSKNFCQAMKFFVHVIVHVPSPVLLLPSRSLLAAALGTLAARATHGGFNRVSLQFYYGQHCRTTALRFGLVV